MAVDPILTVSTIPALCAIVIGGCYLLTRSSSRKYFPSPPSEFLLGHLRTIPLDYPWKTFAALKKDYGECTALAPWTCHSQLLGKGDIIHLSIIGKPMIILNSAKAARDLLQVRGAIYSDRPISALYKMLVIFSGTRNRS